jgi:hypothetical protein
MAFLLLIVVTFFLILIKGSKAGGNSLGEILRLGYVPAHDTLLNIILIIIAILFIIKFLI